MRLYCLLLLLWLGGLLWAQKVSNTIVFEETKYNFGVIFERNGKVSHAFVFKNNGKDAIIIDHVHSDCGCTAVDFTKGPIKPGQKGKIVVTFNPSYRPGYFSRELVVFSNKKEYYSRIWVMGKVIAATHPVEEDYPYAFGHDLHFNLQVLAFGNMKKGSTKSITLKYANNSEKLMTLAFFCSSNDIVIPNPGKVKPGERGEITVSYTHRATKPGETVLVILPVLNGKKMQKEIRVKAVGVN
jgi:hypothetical protein